MNNEESAVVVNSTTSNATAGTSPQVSTQQTELANVPPQSTHRTRNIVLAVAIILIIGITSCFGGYYYYLQSPKGIMHSIIRKQSVVTSYEANVAFSVASTTIMSGTMQGDLTKGLYALNSISLDNSLENNIILGERGVYIKLKIKDERLAELMSFPDRYFFIDSSSEKNILSETTKIYSGTPDLFKLLGAVSNEWEVRVEQSGAGDIYVVSKTIDGLKENATIMARYNKSTSLPVSFSITTSEGTFSLDTIRINVPTSIEIPQNAITFEDWMMEKELAIVQKVKIDQIGLYRTKGVTDEDIAVAQTAIKEFYGFSNVAVYGTPIETFPKKSPFYNVERKQFDADILWDAFSRSLKSDDITKRYFLLTEEDLFTTIQKDRPYVLSRTLPKNNTIIISTNRLKTSSSTDPLVQMNLSKERLTKLVVRTLGVSLGIAYAKDSESKSCIFYQASRIEELDETGKDLCPFAKKAIPQLFK